MDDYHLRLLLLASITNSLLVNLLNDVAAGNATMSQERLDEINKFIETFRNFSLNDHAASLQEDEPQNG